MKVRIHGLFAAIALLSGCVATPVPPIDRRVTIAEDLGQDIYVTDVRCTKGQSDFLTVQANVVNNTWSDLGVSWKVQWLDADGIEIDSIVSNWRDIVISSKEIRGLKGTAPTSDAADMRIHFRRRRDN